jgi:hypothetical protein
VDFVVRHAMDLVVHRDLVVGCFVRRWHRQGVAEKFKILNENCGKFKISPTHHSSQRVHRSPQRFRDSSRWRLLGITARRVHSTTLDENSHKNEEHDAHQHTQVPVLNHILLQRLQQFFVEQEILQSHQWTVGINSTTFEEHVTIALEVITGSTWSQANTTFWQSISFSELAGGSTSRWIIAILTCELTKSSLVKARLRGTEEALSLVPRQTNRSRALATDAKLCSIVALGLIFAGLWFGTFACGAITH